MMLVINHKKVLNYSRMLLEKYKDYLKKKDLCSNIFELNDTNAQKTKFKHLFLFLAIICLPIRKIERLKNSNLYKKLFH